jgi:hypothetical protein
MSVGRADDSSVEPSKLGKVRNESDEAEQVPSSGIRLPGFIKSFLNFIWPAFGSPFTGEASFSNWREKKERVQSLANKVADSTEFEDVAVKALIQKRFETLFESLPLDSLNQLNTIVQEQPHTAYFLFRSELRYKDSAQIIPEMLSKPNFAKATMEMSDKLSYIGLTRGGVFDFVRETFKTKNEDYIREFNDFVSNPLDYNPPEGLLETVVGKKIVCKNFSEEAEAFISSQHSENQPLLLAWMIQEPDIAAEAFKVVTKIESHDDAIDFLQEVQFNPISAQELKELNDFLDNPHNEPVPTFVLDSDMFYKLFKSAILSKFNQQEEIQIYLNRFNVPTQRQKLERMLEDTNFTDRAFALQDRFAAQFGFESTNSFARAVFENCDSEWIDDFEHFQENPRAETRESLLNRANRNGQIVVFLKKIGPNPPGPFTLKGMIDEVKEGNTYIWENGELALTAEMPATEVEQFKNIVFVDPKTLEEVTEGIHSPPREFKHQIAIPTATGGFRYSDSMIIDRVEGGYIFKLKEGQKTFEYKVQGELATEEEIKEAILMARVAWIKEGL